jgi:hypothetical protein
MTSTSVSTNEHRRQKGLIRRKSGSRSRDYKDAEFGDPKRIEFDADDLIDAAVDVYLNPRKASPTIRDPPVRANSRRSATPGRNRAGQ